MTTQAELELIARDEANPVNERLAAALEALRMANDETRRLRGTNSDLYQRISDERRYWHNRTGSTGNAGALWIES